MTWPDVSKLPWSAMHRKTMLTLYHVFLTCLAQRQTFSILFFFNFQATMLLEYICLFVFILRLFHVWCFAAGVKFWRDKKNVILLAVIVVRYFSYFTGG